MRIIVDGVEYSNFQGANVAIRLDALADSFSFTAGATKDSRLPFKKGQAVQAMVDGERQLTGFIELVNVDGQGLPAAHSINVQGRDRTGDILDSTIGVLSDIRPPVTLKRIAEAVIQHLDPTTPKAKRIQVVDLVKPAAFNPAEDLFAADPGMGAFEVLETWARKRQVLLSSDGDGNLVITASLALESEGVLQNRIDDDDDSNNVMTYSFSDDDTGRFNAYQSASQLNVQPTLLTDGISFDQIVGQGTNRAAVRDAAIRKGRQLILTAEAQYSDTEDDKRATWEANVRKARGRVYSATVRGFRDQGGELWEVNRLVQVTDEWCDINAKMLVNSVSFSMDLADGRTTALTLVEENAYTLELEDPDLQELGDDF